MKAIYGHLKSLVEAYVSFPLYIGLAPKLCNLFKKSCENPHSIYTKIDLILPLKLTDVAFLYWS